MASQNLPHDTPGDSTTQNPTPSHSAPGSYKTIDPHVPCSRASELFIECQEFGGTSAKHRYVTQRWIHDQKQYFKALNSHFGKLRLVDIDIKHISDYQRERSKTAGPNKINQELTTLIRLMKRAGAWKPQFDDLYMKLQSEEPDIPRALKEAEQRRLLDIAASRAEWKTAYCYLIIALQTSMSNCEMRGLRRCDFAIESKVVRVSKIHAKNKHRLRTIPLEADSLWAAEQLLERAFSLGSKEPQHFVFPVCFGGTFFPEKPMTPSGIRKPFNEIREAAGVPWLRIHDLRHTAITRLAEKGESLPRILSIAGHVSVKMQQHYTWISDQIKREIMKTVATKRHARSSDVEQKAAVRAAMMAPPASASQIVPDVPKPPARATVAVMNAQGMTGTLDLVNWNLFSKS